MSVDQASFTNIPSIIFVRLTNEAVDVWRPVIAFQKAENIFQIDPLECIPPEDEWEFEPGEYVQVAERRSGPKKVLTAIARAAPTPISSKDGN
jgi:hypothetical protein